MHAPLSLLHTLLNSMCALPPAPCTRAPAPPARRMRIKKGEMIQQLQLDLDAAVRRSDALGAENDELRRMLAAHRAQPLAPPSAGQQLVPVQRAATAHGGLPLLLPHADPRAKAEAAAASIAAACGPAASSGAAASAGGPQTSSASGGKRRRPAASSGRHPAATEEPATPQASGGAHPAPPLPAASALTANQSVDGGGAAAARPQPLPQAQPMGVVPIFTGQLQRHGSAGSGHFPPAAPAAPAAAAQLPQSQAPVPAGLQMINRLAQHGALAAAAFALSPWPHNAPGGAPLPPPAPAAALPSPSEPHRSAPTASSGVLSVACAAAMRAATPAQPARGSAQVGLLDAVCAEVPDHSLSADSGPSRKKRRAHPAASGQTDTGSCGHAPPAGPEELRRLLSLPLMPQLQVGGFRAGSAGPGPLDGPAPTPCSSGYPVAPTTTQPPPTPAATAPAAQPLPASTWPGRAPPTAFATTSYGGGGGASSGSPHAPGPRPAAGGFAPWSGGRGGGAAPGPQEAVPGLLWRPGCALSPGLGGGDDDDDGALDQLLADCLAGDGDGCGPAALPPQPPMQLPALEQGPHQPAAWQWQPMTTSAAGSFPLAYPDFAGVQPSQLPPVSLPHQLQFTLHMQHPDPRPDMNQQQWPAPVWLPAASAGCPWPPLQPPHGFVPVLQPPQLLHHQGSGGVMGLVAGAAVSAPLQQMSGGGSGQ
jgi:hypothetical protein